MTLSREAAVGGPGLGPADDLEAVIGTRLRVTGR
jgi:hypothetical protein